MDGQRLTPQQRRLRAQIAAHTRWSRTEDRSAATASARSSFLARFEAEVDPDGLLDPSERARRATNAMRAHMARLSLRAASARRQSAPETRRAS